MTAKVGANFRLAIPHMTVIITSLDH